MHKQTNCYDLRVAIYSLFLKTLFISRKGGGEREGEKHQCVVASAPSTTELAGNPGMCPDQELNR